MEPVFGAIDDKTEFPGFKMKQDTRLWCSVCHKFIKDAHVRNRTLYCDDCYKKLKAERAVPKEEEKIYQTNDLQPSTPRMKCAGCKKPDEKFHNTQDGSLCDSCFEKRREKHESKLRTSQEDI